MKTKSSVTGRLLGLFAAMFLLLQVTTPSTLAENEDKDQWSTEDHLFPETPFIMKSADVLIRVIEGLQKLNTCKTVATGDEVLLESNFGKTQVAPGLDRFAFDVTETRIINGVEGKKRKIVIITVDRGQNGKAIKVVVNANGRPRLIKFATNRQAKSLHFSISPPPKADEIEGFNVEIANKLMLHHLVLAGNALQGFRLAAIEQRKLIFDDKGNLNEFDIFDLSPSTSERKGQENLPKGPPTKKETPKQKRAPTPRRGAPFNPRDLA